MSNLDVNVARITREVVLDRTRVKADLSNIFEDSLGGRLDKLVNYLNEAALDAEGQSAAIETVSDLLSRRAHLLQDHIDHPEIGEEVIDSPIIVTGCPRSGTTLLNMLIGQHPDNRIPEWWETTRPSPPLGIMQPDDPRRADADQEVADLVRTDPSLLLSHPYFDEGGAAAAECEAFGALNLQVMRRTLYFRVPAFLSIDLMDDPVEYYRFHKKLLQSLQWRMPKRRWALKGVEHHVRLEALKTVYPDAKVVWVHRDPQKIFPSVFELNARLVEGTIGKPVDRKEVGARLMEVYGGQLDRATQSPLIGHPDIHHLLYADFAASPVAQIEAIYRKFDLPFDERASAAMTQWLERNKGDRHGKFSYSLEAFGLTPEALEERFGAYRQRFGIPVEGVRA
ncbi:sulfotransferase [Novosphingobium sp. 9U]|uniref:sulfotransferase family protein n=1 Tax=Novosphingobium sp. 9U TaxID=2653158 RepID=UPI0012F199B1|nr:sulfotransferase [Novosphingobium sp. 9U]VWX50596.1 putative Sulfotransferase family protein [Novosphingobium sp. 9U]